MVASATAAVSSVGGGKGACCVDGDAGAPLLEKEVTILEDIYEAFLGALYLDSGDFNIVDNPVSERSV